MSALLSLSKLIEACAAEQDTARERVLLEAALRGSALANMDASEVCRLRAQLQNQAAGQVINAGFATEGSVLALRFGEQKLVWWRPTYVPPAGFEPGVPFTMQVDVGEPMRAGDVIGVYDGFDWRGRACLRDVRGVEHVVAWRDVGVLRPAEWRPSPEELRVPVVGTAHGASKDASEQQTRGFDACLNRKAFAGYSHRHFVDALRREGYFVCMRGSAVRDVINGDPVNDVDFITTAPATEIWRIVCAAAPELKLGAPKQASMPIGFCGVDMQRLDLDGEGFEAMSMLRRPIESLSYKHPETHGSYAPGRFGTNLEENAWVHDLHINTLYAYRDEFECWCLSDPTGLASDDVLQKRLTRPRSIQLASYARFWKFRLRGYTSDDATKTLMLEDLAGKAAALSLSSFVRNWKRVAKDYPSADLFLQALRELMYADGAGESFERYLNTEAFRAALRE